MNEATKQEIFTRLDALAEKLNVTGEHLWGVVLLQVRVEIVFHLMWLASGLFLLAASVVGAVLIHRRLKVIDKKRPGYGYDEWWGLHVLPIAASIIGLGVIGANLNGLLTPLLNPEYWALQKIIGLHR